MLLGPHICRLGHYAPSIRGLLAAKSGIRVIDVSRIDQNIQRVTDQCKASPDLTVPQAYHRALGRKGRS
jgi:hypothetical protein